MRLSDSSISNPVTQNRNKCLTGGHVRGLRITRDVVAQLQAFMTVAQLSVGDMIIYQMCSQMTVCTKLVSEVKRKKSHESTVQTYQPEFP